MLTFRGKNHYCEISFGLYFTLGIDIVTGEKMLGFLFHFPFTIISTYFYFKKD
jgi:hypothetical protein